MLYFPQVWAAGKVVFDGLGADDSKEFILKPLQPREASMGLNGYNLADTWEVAFFADKLPISPELIRALSIDLYAFQTDKLEVDPTPYLVEENLIVTGIADEVTLDYSDGGRIVRASGRDYTGLLIDKKWRPDKGIDIGEDLQWAVQGVLDEFYKVSGNQGIKLRAVWSSDKPAPVVAFVKEGVTQKKTVHKSKTKPKTSKGRSRVTKKRLPVPTGRSYWDVIYELCLSYGFIAYVQGEEVIIHEPQALADEAGSKAITYAFGHNLSTLNISRKLSNHAAPQVVASYYDQREKAYIEVRFPEDKKANPTGAGGNTIKFRRVTPPAGIEDKETLRAYLAAAYHMYGRSEASLRFTTKALRGLASKDQSELDDSNNILRVRPGSPMAFGWDSVGRVDMKELHPDERYGALLDKGFSSEIAQVIANNYDRLDSLRRPFYLKALSFSWSITDGLSVEGEGINYVNPKRDAAQTEWDRFAQ